jgi:hypothetical protein
LADAIGGRSREGKFIRRIEAELLDQLGDNPTFAQLRPHKGRAPDLA